MISDHEFLRTRTRLDELASAVYSLDILSYLNRLEAAATLGGLFDQSLPGGDVASLAALARAALTFQNQIRRLAVEQGKQ